MGIDHRLAPVELRHDRLERGITEPEVAVAGKHRDAVGLEHVEPELDLAQAAFDIGERQGGEHAEAAGMILHQPCGILITLPRDAAAVLAGERAAGRGHRRDRGRDAGLVHVIERLGDAPGDHRRLQVAFELRDVFRGRDVVMDVDAVRLALACRRRLGQRPRWRKASGGAEPQSSGSAQHRPPARRGPRWHTHRLLATHAAAKGIGSPGLRRHARFLTRTPGFAPWP